MEEKILSIIKTVLELNEVHNSISQESCDRWDSLNHLNIILEVESEFEVSFTPEEIVELKSARSITDLLLNKQSC